MATKKQKEAAAKQFKITLVKSPISCTIKQKRTVEALGLKKIRSFNVLTDGPVLQGMLNVVGHLVMVEEAKG